MIASLLISLSPFSAVDGTVFLPVLYLVAAFLVGAVLITLVQRWRRRSPSLGPSASDQLAQFRTLYEQGAISEEEYRRLRSILGGELRRANDLPAQPTATPTATTTATGPTEPAQPSGAEKPPPDSDQPPASGIRPA